MGTDLSSSVSSKHGLQRCHNCLLTLCVWTLSYFPFHPQRLQFPFSGVGMTNQFWVGFMQDSFIWLLRGVATGLASQGSLLPAYTTVCAHCPLTQLANRTCTTTPARPLGPSFLYLTILSTLCCVEEHGFFRAARSFLLLPCHVRPFSWTFTLQASQGNQMCNKVKPHNAGMFSPSQGSFLHTPHWGTPFHSGIHGF